ncbi:HNH endonuclease [Mesorhizobium sp. M1322]|uniref:HNH endonuclease n=1 Tax=Mesorhizobium sp. M1322 TaxID=2957081 RepID=UPI003334BF12
MTRTLSGRPKRPGPEAPEMGKAQRRHLRWLLFGQQEGCCFYCGQMMSLSFARRDNIWGNSATLEHLQRKADGGGSGKANVVLACKDCNQRRGNRPVEVYRALRRDGRMT